MSYIVAGLPDANQVPNRGGGFTVRVYSMQAIIVSSSARYLTGTSWILLQQFGKIMGAR